MGLLARFAGGLLLVVSVGCASRPLEESVQGARGGIELAENQKVFRLAATLAEERSLLARLEGAASRSGGAFFGNYVDGTGAPVFAANGTRIRGSCGITLIAPSFGITAGHCVDATNTDLTALSLEMFRPTPAIETGYLRAASLGGTFPSYDHPRLGTGDGYFTDRYDCTLVARCSNQYGGPFGCSTAASSGNDIALVRCDGAPGNQYGYVDIAGSDPLTAPVFMPWKHEIYDLPLDSTDPRWSHYTAYASSGVANNYHYFGVDTSGVDQNQLLPLIAPDFDGNTQHTKVSTSNRVVTTDLLGCHGTSGSGVLQQSDGGFLELLGPADLGNHEHNSFLCNHLPSLDTTANGPGQPGIAYIGLASTAALVADNRSALDADCDPFAAGAASPLTHLACPRNHLAGDSNNAAFAAHLAPPSVAPSLAYAHDEVAALSAGETAGLGGFSVQAGEHYRIGVNAWAGAGCVDASSCPQISVSSGNRQLLGYAFEAAVSSSIPLADSFAADTTGALPLQFTVTRGGKVELGAIALRAEGRVNGFDTQSDRLEASLFDLATAPPAAMPMRFVGDGKRGFAAWLLAGERMVLTRQAIVPGRKWTAKFSVSPAAALTCGLLDSAGTAAVQADCSSGLVQLDDGTSPGPRAAFFVATASGGGSVSIDDLQLVSDAAPDTDGDSIPDPVDVCPNGPAKAGQPLQVTLADSVTFPVCVPEPAVVALPIPAVADACDAPVLSGRITAVRGKSLGSLVVDVPSTDGKVLLPIGDHTVTWQVLDRAGHVYATVAETVHVVESIGPQCCASGQTLASGSDSADISLPNGNGATCALAGGGDDFVVTGSAADWLWGGSGSDYLQSGAGNDVLLGGDGDDYLAVGGGGQVTIYAGAGDDTVHAGAAASARIFGESGADVLVGSEGPDDIFPGAGAVRVLAGGGDDVITVYDPCELTRGLVLSGGAGNDMLVSPIARADLVNRGVVLDGIENVTVDASRSYLSECFGGN